VQLLYVGKLSIPKYHEFSLNNADFANATILGFNYKTVAILLFLLIIQLTVYNSKITRFIADDKVVYQRVRGGDTICFRQLLSTTSFEACELEMTVNYFSVHTLQ